MTAHEGAVDLAPAAVRARRPVPHAVDRRGDAMRRRSSRSLLCCWWRRTSSRRRRGAPRPGDSERRTGCGAGTLTIAGTGFGARPFVTLDLVPLNIQLALDQRIIAVVPVGMIPPGSYLLTVTRGSQAGRTASFEVRIGLAPATVPAAAPPASTGSGSARRSRCAECGHRRFRPATPPRELATRTITHCRRRPRMAADRSRWLSLGEPPAVRRTASRARRHGEQRASRPARPRRAASRLTRC